MSLTWTAGITVLQGAGLLLEIMQLSTEGWLLSARSWSETFLFILLKDTIRWESLLIIDKISLGLEPVTCRSKALRPPQSLEN